MEDSGETPEPLADRRDARAGGENVVNIVSHANQLPSPATTKLPLLGIDRRSFDLQQCHDEHSNNCSEPKLDRSVGHFAAGVFGCIAPGKSEGLLPIDEGSPLPPWYQAGWR